MSSIAQAWARQQKHPSLKSADLLLLRELAEWADPFGKIKNDEEEGIFFDYKILAELCNVSVRTIPRMLSKLEKLGLIKRKPRYADNGYQIRSDYLLLIPENYVIKIENRNHAISGMRNTLNNKELQNNTGAQARNDEPCQNGTPAMPKWHSNIKRSNKGNKDINKYIDSRSKNEQESSLVDEQFNQFWKLYPKKADKKNASTIYKKLILDKKISQESIIAGLKNYLAYVQNERKYGFALSYRNPCTWLNAENWNDQYPTEEQIKNERSKPNNRSGKADVYEGYNLYEGTIFDPHADVPPP